jgi:hypothetical protein
MEASVFSQPFADIALILVQLGFAALLGFVARNSATWLHRVAFVLAALAYVASSLAIPLDWPINVAAGIASVAVFAVTAWRAKAGSFHPRVAWWYAGIAMLAIVSWSATQGWLSPVALLGIAAGCAAVLSWRRASAAIS